MRRKAKLIINLELILTSVCNTATLKCSQRQNWRYSFLVPVCNYGNCMLLMGFKKSPPDYKPTIVACCGIIRMTVIILMCETRLYNLHMIDGYPT